VAIGGLFKKDNKMNRRPNMKGPAPMRRPQARPNMERPETRPEPSPNPEYYWRRRWWPWHGYHHYYDWDWDYYDYYYDYYYDWDWDYDYDYSWGGYSVDPEQAYRKGVAEGRRQAAMKLRKPQQEECEEEMPAPEPRPINPESTNG
jgi:hypothetical protein